MHPDLAAQILDPNDEPDQEQTQGVELHGTPGRTTWHGRAQGPHEPVGAVVQEQAHLVGVCLVARRSVGGEVGLPGLDVIFRLSASAIDFP